jgi:WD40 repeat protein
VTALVWAFALRGLCGADEATPIEWIQGGHYYVYCGAYPADGRYLASGADDHTAKIWRASDGELLRTLEIGATVYDVAFSPDSSVVATATYFDDVTLWRIEDGQAVRVLDHPSGPIRALAFSPDGELLATGYGGGAIGYVYLWRVSDGEMLRSMKTFGIKSLAFSPDGRILASAGVATINGAYITLWNPSDGSLIRKITAHRHEIFSVAFSPDGELLASGSDELRIWRIDDSELLAELSGAERAFQSLAFSPDGRILVAGDGIGNVLVWSTNDWTFLDAFQPHVGAVSGVVYSPDGSALLTTSNDGSVKLWRTDDWKPIRWVTTEYSRASAGAEFSADGEHFACYGYDGLKIGRVVDGGVVRTFDAKGPAFAFSGDGTLIAAPTNDRIAIWRVSDGELVLRLDESGYAPRTIAFAPNGALLAAPICNERKDVQIWDATDGRKLRLLIDRRSWVSSLRFSPDSELLASSGKHGTYVWRMSDGALVAWLEDAWPSPIRFTPDGTQVAGYFSETELRFYNTSDWTLARTLEAPQSYAFAIAPNARTLLIGLEDGGIEVRRITDGTLLRSYRREAGPGAYSLACSPDSMHFVFTRSDTTIALVRNPFAERRGDLNSDADVDFDDIDAFVLALTDPSGYAEQNPDCFLSNADINRDGNIDVGDIDPFVQLLTGD